MEYLKGPRKVAEIFKETQGQRLENVVEFGYERLWSICGMRKTWGGEGMGI